MNPSRMSVHDCLQLLRVTRNFVASGRGWRAAFRYLEESDRSKRLSSWTRHFLRICETDGAEAAFLSCRNHGRIESRLVMSALLAVERGLPHAEQSLHQLYLKLREWSEHEKEERSHLFLPVTQSLLVVLVAVVFTAVVPIYFGDLLPSFLSFGLWSEFSLGAFFIFLGLYLVWWVSRWPQRSLSMDKDFSLILMELSLYLSLDQDFLVAWESSIQQSRFFQKKWKKVYAGFNKTQSVIDLIGELGRSLSVRHREALDSLIWKYQFGSRLSDHCAHLSEECFKEYLQHWRMKAKVAAFFSLIPISFCIMPAVLYLMIGPQFVLLGMSGVGF